MSETIAEGSLAATNTEVLRRKGKSFYWAGQLLTEQQLNNAAQLYQLCRNIDDIADEAVTVAQVKAADKQLGEFHQALVAKPMASATTSLLYQQAQSLFDVQPLALHALADLVNTVRQDLQLVRVSEHAALLRYCYGVAGTVGVMMTCLLGARQREKALPHAIDLGIAMQLTNISRDVLEDAHLNRMYLPADGIAGVIAPDAIIAANTLARHNAWLGVVDLLNLAEKYYKSGWQGLGYLPFRARLAIAVAAKVYRQIGQQILQKGEQQYWQSRSVIGLVQKLKLTVVALFQVALAAVSRQTTAHNKALHYHLNSSVKLPSQKHNDV
jgi:phytoene synthase